MKNIKNNWCKANTGNHQGLVCDDVTGENVAVTYKKENTQLIASAPELLKVCKIALSIMQEYKISIYTRSMLEQVIAKTEED